MRPWLYEESPLLKEFYRMIGATGIPVGLAEVYGTLQTGMINVVWSSSILAALLRWHSKTKYVSAMPVGVIQGAFVFSRRFWDSLLEHEREAILDMADRDRRTIQKEMRKADERVYKSLMKRGITPVEWEDREKWRAVGKRLRDRMVGRIYSRELLTRVEKIVAKYPDDKRFAKMVR
jgi:TRAP-type C4-dicarboxylate transport system substrate-binding protein